MRTFELPDLGEGLTEAEVVKWLVATGDQVTLNRPLAEVETAKATVEVPSPYEGHSDVLHADVGDVVSVGAPLVTIRQDAAPPPSGEASGNVLVGYGTRAGTPTRRPRAAYPPAASGSTGCHVRSDG